jgi:MFS family permease
MALVNEYMQIAAPNPLGAQPLHLAVLQADELQRLHHDKRWMVHTTYNEKTLAKPGAAWSAVTSMALCVAVIMVTSLFIAGLTRNIDRRIVLSFFSLLLIVSGMVVTFASSYATLMIGRALLGLAIGGFWSMSTNLMSQTCLR